MKMKICNGWRLFLFGLPLIFFLPYLLSVMELHQNSSAQEPQKKLQKKFDHLVLGSAAGQGLPNRLQCQGTKSLNKTHSSHNVSRVEDIAFVTVFTIYNSSVSNVDDRSSNTIIGDSSYNKVRRSMAVLNVFVNFIQVTMPQSSVIILTDPASDFSLQKNRVFLYPIQGEYSRDKLMLQRIRSYISFLETKLQELTHRPGNTTHYIFTDSDIAVVDDLGHIFRDHQNFHLALTFRNNKAQPLNSGFIAVRGTADAILRAKLFLQEVLKVYSTKYMNASRMLGDQLALAWVVKSHPSFDASRFSKARPFTDNIGVTSVLFLPCAIYNWTPPEGAGQFHGMPLDVKVVHFKGSRKRLMLESWNFYKSSPIIEDMLCLILETGMAGPSDRLLSSRFFTQISPPQLQVYATGFVPFIGKVLDFLLLSWMYAYYCFEYKWNFNEVALDKRLDYFQSSCAFFSGFGSPCVLAIFFFLPLVSYGTMAILFPLFVLTATGSKVDQEISFERSKWRGVTIGRLPIFHIADKVSMWILSLIPLENKDQTKDNKAQ